MIVVTGADHRFKTIVAEWLRHIIRFGFNYKIYDLGYLGYGLSGFEETNSNFKINGWYNDIEGKWKSTGLWKPKVIADALIQFNDDVLYLDADAYMMQYVAVDFSQFDIGVVRRVPCPEKDCLKNYLRGAFNAGVLFFSNTPATLQIVKNWNSAIETVKNDQLALNNLLRDTEYKSTECTRIKWFEPEYNATDDTIKNPIIRHWAGNKKQQGKVRRL